MPYPRGDNKKWISPTPPPFGPIALLDSVARAEPRAGLVSPSIRLGLGEGRGASCGSCADKFLRNAAR